MNPGYMAFSWPSEALIILLSKHYFQIQLQTPKGKEPCKVSNSHQGPIVNIAYIRSSQNDVCSTVTRRGVKTRLSRPPFHRPPCSSDP